MKYIIVLIMSIALMGCGASRESFNRLDNYEVRKKAIKTIRKEFKIPESTTLHAVPVIDVILPIDHLSVGCANDYYLGITIKEFLPHAVQINKEVYVYGNGVEKLYIVNKILVGSVKPSKDLYRASPDDVLLARFFSKSDYDYIYHFIDGCMDSGARAYLCVKEDKIDFLYIINGRLKHKEVTKDADLGVLLNAASLDTLE